MAETSSADRRIITRRRFLAGGALATAGLGLYAWQGERHLLFTEHVTVRIQNLPTAFHGFRIAQLSDFHYLDFNEPWFIRHTVNEVNKLKPDMVALTGDFITGYRVQGRYTARYNQSDADACAEILKEIECPLRFSSLGNHDALLPQGVISALRRNGHTPLNNDYTAIDLRGDRLWIGGLADAYMDVPRLAQAIPQRKEGEPIILLGHEPDFADTVKQFAPVDLMLAGHSHGGQVRIPFMPAMLLPAMGVNYVEGLFSLSNGMQLYVNRGHGTMHLPIRFNCPPELTILTLQPA